VRCARCGNNNTEGNRFCGMCGAPLVAPAAVRPAPASSSNVPVMPRPTSISSPPLNVPPVAAPPNALKVFSRLTPFADPNRQPTPR
jgi:hypothetical protein